MDTILLIIAAVLFFVAALGVRSHNFGWAGACVLTVALLFAFELVPS